MKVAIVHDWLVSIAGGEKVLAELLAIFPEADLFAVVDFLDPDQRAHLLGKHATTTFVQRLPFARRRYRSYLPLMMMAIEQIDLQNYDLVVSSSHAVAKGVITGPDQLHISYVHSPIRYAWDLQHSYLRESGLTRGLKSAFARATLHYVRMWDVRTANGVDHFVANSAFIRRRIWKVYRRESSVVHPPVDVEAFTPGGEKQDYYFTASRLVPYKRLPLIAEAFSAMPDKRLVVVGDGPEMPALKRAAGRNVTILGAQPHAQLLHHFRAARAFIFAAEEDFGITPVEAQACGTPVIAFGRGGALETVRGPEHEAPTGVFFPEQSVGSIIAAVQEFERHSDRFTSASCRNNALRFSAEAFRRNFIAVVNDQVAAADGMSEGGRSRLSMAASDRGRSPLGAPQYSTTQPSAPSLLK